MRKTALITGVTGQDGAYLTQLLLEKNYNVYGTIRGTSARNFWRLRELGLLQHERFKFVDFDVTDFESAISMIDKYEPDEIYNFAAQSVVGRSFDQPLVTARATGLGVVNLLESIRLCNEKIKFYQASSSEMFGKAQAVPQNEQTTFYPQSPYAIAKLYAHWMVVNYRKTYGVFGASGILFNHESPLRGEEFVTRKITKSVAQIKFGLQDKLQLGNVNAERDWGFAGDYVVGMWEMLQLKTPETFVLATNRTKSVRDFTTMAFKSAGVDIEWSGKGVEETAVNTATGKIVVDINPVFYRPIEAESLIGDASYAKKMLGWEAKVELEELCEMMVQADLKRVQSECFTDTI